MLTAVPARFTVNEDGTVYLRVEPSPPIDDDCGYGVQLSAADVLAGALRFLSEDLLAPAIELERKESA